jgi:hypothetical protein
MDLFINAVLHLLIQNANVYICVRAQGWQRQYRRESSQSLYYVGELGHRDRDRRSWWASSYDIRVGFEHCW